MGYSCLTNTQTRLRGKQATVAPGPRRGQTRGDLEQARYIRQVLYGTSGELKGVKEGTNGARERKASYTVYSMVLSKPAIRIPESESELNDERFEGGASHIGLHERGDGYCEMAHDPHDPRAF